MNVARYVLIFILQVYVQLPWKMLSAYVQITLLRLRNGCIIHYAKLQQKEILIHHNVHAWIAFEPIMVEISWYYLIHGRCTYGKKFTVVSLSSASGLVWALSLNEQLSRNSDNLNLFLYYLIRYSISHKDALGKPSLYTPAVSVLAQKTIAERMVISFYFSVY